MSADTTEQNAANGEQLRERYLPVSRKELRRRREAELAAQRQQETDTPEPQEEPERADLSSAEESATSEPSPGPEPESQNEHAEDELSRAVQATFASESDELPQEPEIDEDDAAETASSDVEDDFISDDDASAAAQPSAEPAEPAVLPEPPEEEPARPEEEIADAEADLVLEDEDTTQVISSVSELPEEEPAAAPEEAAQLPEGEDTLSGGGAAGAATQPASMAESRRVRRMLRETQSIPPLSPELLAELDATNAEIAKAEDATAVDPELLKRQQSLAAKAMQANQERMRKEHAKAEKDRRRRSRERPESQILTEKMVRDSLEQDPEEMQYATGQIEPVHAQGAHGLDLNKMIDATSRQADRQKVLIWTAIVLGILLLAAIATVAFVLF